MNLSKLQEIVKDRYAAVHEICRVRDDLPTEQQQQCFNLKLILIYLQLKCLYQQPVGLPRWHSGKESICQAGDERYMGPILGWGRSPGVGNGNPVQYSCLGNPMDRAAWRATVYEDAELDTTEHSCPPRTPYILCLPQTDTRHKSTVHNLK